MRAGSAAVRRAQTGFLRYYAALMVVGLSGVALYFLISSDMTLSILIWLPLAIALLAALAPRPLVGRVSPRSAAWSRSGSRSRSWRASSSGHAGLQFVTDKVWISALGIHYKLGLDGLNVALVLLTTVLFSAVADLGVVPRVGPAAASSTSTSGSPRAPCSARSAPRTWRCSSRSST